MNVYRKVKVRAEMEKIVKLESVEFWSRINCRVRRCFFMDGVLCVGRVEREISFSDLFCLEAYFIQKFSDLARALAGQ